MSMIIVGATACGDVEQPADLDAPNIDATETDAATDATPAACNRSGAWQLAPIMGLDSAGHAWFTDDLLTAYIHSSTLGGPGSYDIYSSTRASTSDPFPTPVVTQGASTAADERLGLLSPDRLNLYFSRLAPNNLHYDMFVATRSSTAGVFSAGDLMANVNGSSDEHANQLSANGLRMYVSSLRTANWEIYETTRASASDPFGALQPMGALNVVGVADTNAVLPADELTVYFSSNRPGSMSYDVWVATRSTTQDGFGTPQRDTQLSSSSSDVPIWISSNGCFMVIGTDRPGGGGAGLWLASRPPS